VTFPNFNAQIMALHTWYQRLRLDGSQLGLLSPLTCSTSNQQTKTQKPINHKTILWGI